MANTSTTNEYYEKIVVDTAPGADGYWTEPVSLRRKLQPDLDKVFFSVFEEDNSVISVATPILQYSIAGGDWQDYRNDGEDFAVGDGKIIEGNSGNVRWRAGVKQGGLTSGSIVIMLHW